MYEFRCSVPTLCMDLVVATAYSAADYRYSSTSAVLALSRFFLTFISSAPPSNMVTLANCKVAQSPLEEESLFYTEVYI